MSANLLVIFLAAVFTENILLARFLGMCSFLAVSRQIRTAVGLGGAVTFVLACTSVLNWIVYHAVLVRLDLVYLRFIVFIVVIAAFVQIVEMIIERVSQTLYAALGIFLPRVRGSRKRMAAPLRRMIVGSNIMIKLLTGYWFLCD